MKTNATKASTQSKLADGSGTAPTILNGKREIVYLKDQLDARLAVGMCPSISCPGHCSCAGKRR